MWFAGFDVIFCDVMDFTLLLKFRIWHLWSNGP